jgi:hypothetical protein
LREIPDQITAYFDGQALIPGEKNEKAQEKFKENREPDTYFPSVSEKLANEAVKLGADKS